MARAKKPQVRSQERCFIITLGDQARVAAAGLLHNLRTNNILVDMDYAARSLKAQMRQANDLGVRFCMIIGEDELVKGSVSLKDMVSGKQEEIEQGSLIKELKNRLQFNSC